MLYALIFITSTCFAAEVKNTVSRQEGNRVVFTFDVEPGGGQGGIQEEADLTLTITIDGKTYDAKTSTLKGILARSNQARARRYTGMFCRTFREAYGAI